MTKQPKYTEARLGLKGNDTIQIPGWNNLDPNRPEFQRFLRVIKEVEADLGGSANLSAAERLMVQRVAGLTLLSEYQEALAMLPNGKPDYSAYSTIINTLSRSLERLGLFKKTGGKSAKERIMDITK